MLIPIIQQVHNRPPLRNTPAPPTPPHTGPPQQNLRPTPAAPAAPRLIPKPPRIALPAPPTPRSATAAHTPASESSLHSRSAPSTPRAATPSASSPRRPQTRSLHHLGYFSRRCISQPAPLPSLHRQHRCVQGSPGNHGLFTFISPRQQQLQQRLHRPSRSSRLSFKHRAPRSPTPAFTPQHLHQSPRQLGLSNRIASRGPHQLHHLAKVLVRLPHHHRNSKLRGLQWIVPSFRHQTPTHNRHRREKYTDARSPIVSSTKTTSPAANGSASPSPPIHCIAKPHTPSSKSAPQPPGNRSGCLGAIISTGFFPTTLPRTSRQTSSSTSSSPECVLPATTSSVPPSSSPIRRVNAVAAPARTSYLNSPSPSPVPPQHPSSPTAPPSPHSAPETAKSSPIKAATILTQPHIPRKRPIEHGHSPPPSGILPRTYNQPRPQLTLHRHHQLRPHHPQIPPHHPPKVQRQIKHRRPLQSLLRQLLPRLRRRRNRNHPPRQRLLQLPHQPNGCHPLAHRNRMHPNGPHRAKPGP